MLPNHVVFDFLVPDKVPRSNGNDKIMSLVCRTTCYDSQFTASTTLHQHITQNPTLNTSCTVLTLNSVLTLLVGRQEGYPTCKTLGVGLLVVMI